MTVSNEIKEKYLNFFFEKIVGFNQPESKVKFVKENECIAIAMDKIARLTRDHGRLRDRVWSNCYFIFHDHSVKPEQAYEDMFSTLKQTMPFLFIRSYVYVIFINTASANQKNLFGQVHSNITTKDFKIWNFNSKYEIKQETRRTNLFGISLKDNESIDDYVYLANPETELERMKSANSDAIDCIRAFTGDLTLLSQTNDMLNEVRRELDSNPRARVLVEGPARSGKTIIAASLLGIYEDAKFLLMNYFFYTAIVDGFHALSNWSKEEIEELVSNPNLEALNELNSKLQDSDRTLQLFNSVYRNLPYAIRECDAPIANSNTQTWLLENISKIIPSALEDGLNVTHFPIFELMIKVKHTALQPDAGL